MLSHQSKRENEIALILYTAIDFVKCLTRLTNSFVSDELRKYCHVPMLPSPDRIEIGNSDLMIAWSPTQVCPNLLSVFYSPFRIVYFVWTLQKLRRPHLLQIQFSFRFWEWNLLFSLKASSSFIFLFNRKISCSLFAILPNNKSLFLTYKSNWLKADNSIFIFPI